MNLLVSRDHSSENQNYTGELREYLCWGQKRSPHRQANAVIVIFLRQTGHLLLTLALSLVIFKYVKIFILKQFNYPPVFKN